MSDTDPFLEEAEAVLVQAWRNDRATVSARVSAAVKYIDLKGTTRVLPDLDKLTEVEADQLLFALLDKCLAQGRFPRGFIEVIRHWIDAHPPDLDDDEHSYSPGSTPTPRTRRRLRRVRLPDDDDQPPVWHVTPPPRLTPDYGDKYSLTEHGFRIDFPNGESASFDMRPREEQR